MTTFQLLLNVASQQAETTLKSLLTTQATKFTNLMTRSVQQTNIQVLVSLNSSVILSFSWPLLLERLDISSMALWSQSLHSELNSLT